eukprot:6831619-Prymnesium_polylepis.1
MPCAPPLRASSAQLTCVLGNRWRAHPPLAVTAAAAAPAATLPVHAVLPLAERRRSGRPAPVV